MAYTVSDPYHCLAIDSTNEQLQSSDCMGTTTTTTTTKKKKKNTSTTTTTTTTATTRTNDANDDPDQEDKNQNTRLQLLQLSAAAIYLSYCSFYSSHSYWPQEPRSRLGSKLTRRPLAALAESDEIRFLRLKDRVKRAGG